jgi:hypothetical protein
VKKLSTSFNTSQRLLNLNQKYWQRFQHLSIHLKHFYIKYVKDQSTSTYMSNINENNLLLFMFHDFIGFSHLKFRNSFRGEHDRLHEFCHSWALGISQHGTHFQHVIILLMVCFEIVYWTILWNSFLFKSLLMSDRRDYIRNLTWMKKTFNLNKI